MEIVHNLSQINNSFGLPQFFSVSRVPSWHQIYGSVQM